MHRTLLTLSVFLIATAMFVVIAQANPLAQIKEAANNTRDAAEAQSEEVAAQAEGKEKHEHADHDEHHGEHDHAEAHAKHGDHDDDDEKEVEVYHAVALMIPTAGNTARGVIHFDETDGGVTVTAEVTGLSPNHKHGFHIHEFGDLSAPDGTATGGHYNPEGHDHALPQSGDAVRHAGDMGNLEADAEGNATYTMTFDNITIFDDNHNPIIGRGVIIHAKTDDGGQPTGNAGARIAQGIVGVAKPK